MTPKTELLIEHAELGKILSKTPDIRKMSYVEELKDDQKFGKPRFIPPNYLINTEPEIRITSHLMN